MIVAAILVAGGSGIATGRGRPEGVRVGRRPDAARARVRRRSPIPAIRDARRRRAGRLGGPGRRAVRRDRRGRRRDPAGSVGAGLAALAADVDVRPRARRRPSVRPGGGDRSGARRARRRRRRGDPRLRRSRTRSSGSTADGVGDHGRPQRTGRGADPAGIPPRRARGGARAPRRTAATDDAALVEAARRARRRSSRVPAQAFKITDAWDLAVAESVVARG